MHVNLDAARLAQVVNRATKSLVAVRHDTRLVATALAITVLTGCSVTERHVLAEAALAPAERGIEGQWLSADGSSATRFSDGAFQTAALDTGKPLARGVYTMTGEANVSITMNSLIRRKTSKVNCLMVDPSQLNCTTEDRRQFVLTRAAAPVLAFQ